MKAAEDSKAEDSKAVLKKRLAAADAEDRKRTSVGSNDMDTSVSVLGKRGQPLADAVDNSIGSHFSQKKRRCVDALRLAFVAGKK